MLLNELLNTDNLIEPKANFDKITIDEITNNSKDVKDNTLFAAIIGYQTDGHKYISDAIQNGAVAVLLQNDSEEISGILRENNITKIIVEDSRKEFAKISNKFYDFPSTKLKLIGITGTKGKTTTSYYIKSILDNAGFKTGLLGTNNNIVGSKTYPTHLTTPDTNIINKFLNEMVVEGCTHCVMEISSHSLELFRVYGLDFDIAIFTNITSDHLDFHKTFENYREAKKILFDNLKSNACAIVNSDDDSWAELTKNTNASITTYGKNENAEIQFSIVSYDLAGTTYSINYNNEKYGISTSLIGEFNAYNATAAFAGCLKLGLETNIIIDGIKITPQVKGRFEIISENNKNVIIDFSHTADSLEKTLLAIKHIVKNEFKIYTVIGCGGDKDKTKRPIMGNIASELSDHVIVTSDNPRTEDPNLIIEDILKGIKKNNYKVIENRREAIKEAIIYSEDKAVILLAGKGHEEYQDIMGVKYNFSEKEIVEQYL